MCVTDRHDVTLAVKVALKLNATNPISPVINIWTLSWRYLMQDISPVNWKDELK